MAIRIMPATARRREPKAVGEGAADDAEAEIKKAGEREHQRHRAARGAEIPLQRFDEGAERVGGAEADEGHRERSGDDEPAIEDAGIGRCCLRGHGDLHPEGRVDSDTSISSYSRVA